MNGSPREKGDTMETVVRIPLSGSGRGGFCVVCHEDISKQVVCGLLDHGFDVAGKVCEDCLRGGGLSGSGQTATVERTKEKAVA